LPAVARALALFASIALAGCGSPHPGGADLSVPADLAVVVGDLAMADMSVEPTGVPCADVKCAPCADQFCDTADYGVTGTCQAHVAAMNLSFACDGPEDCGGGGLGACCLFDGIGATCSGAGCGGLARFMCHDAKLHCVAGENCCPLGPGSTYSVCTTNPC
jgi:hypothetical protein